ncbi:MAG: hypothetical protein WCQ99_04010 [Pseudomonadota bacterium]
MTQIKNPKGTVILTVCCAFLLCCSVDTFAAQRKKTIAPEIVEFVLKAAGINAEIITMRSDHGSEKGVVFEKLEGGLVLLGFPKEGIEPDKPFLLSREGKDSMVAWTDGGGLVVLQGEADVHTLSLVSCILDAVGNMVDTIISCRANVICIINSAFNGVNDILGCI